MMIPEPEVMPAWIQKRRKSLARWVCAFLGHAYRDHEPRKEVRCVRCKLMR